MQCCHQVRARIFLLVGLLLLFVSVSAVSAKPLPHTPTGTRRFTQTDLNNDSRPDDYQVVVGNDQKIVAVVTLSSGQRFRFPLQLPSVGAIIPLDGDRDGDLDLVFFDRDAVLTQTVWNEHSQSFHTGAVEHIRFPGEHSQVASGSGVDAISLTSPPLADQELTAAQIAAATAIPTDITVYSVGDFISHFPLRILICSLTLRGPPAFSFLC
ncbi:MAG: hypothetical protein QM758_07655 [Armatimonas sp.]